MRANNGPSAAIMASMRRAGKAIAHTKLWSKHLEENSHTQKKKNAGRMLSTVNSASTLQRTQENRPMISVPRRTVADSSD
jgi:hypothetical protein